MLLYFLIEQLAEQEQEEEKKATQIQILLKAQRKKYKNIKITKTKINEVGTGDESDVEMLQVHLNTWPFVISLI